MKKQKLIRDNLPKNYEFQKTRIADDKEYFAELVKKLQEEVNEFKENNNIEELADVVEVIYAISEFHGTSVKGLHEIREKKAKERGSFKKRIIWEME